MPDMITAVVGDIEVTLPTNILDFEMERAPGETDEEFAAAEAAYRKLFAAAMAKSRI